MLCFARENEVLKHQLKKYVGAVQMLRSSMNDPSSANTQGKISYDINKMDISE